MKRDKNGAIYSTHDERLKTHGKKKFSYSCQLPDRIAFNYLYVLVIVEGTTITKSA